MDSFPEVRANLLNQITQGGPNVRTEYLKHFAGQAEEFADAMARVVMDWQALDTRFSKNEKAAYVVGFTLAAIVLHVQSFELFLTGHHVPAGNLSRQVVESIALALVCSGHSLGVLEQVMQDQYSTNNAIRDVARHADTLGLVPGALDALKDTQKFYSKYSHPTRLTLANMVSFDAPGTFLGAAFDPHKLSAYESEVATRLALAKVFHSVVAGVAANLSKWPGVPGNV